MAGKLDRLMRELDGMETPEFAGARESMRVLYRQPGMLWLIGHLIEQTNQRDTLAGLDLITDEGRHKAALRVGEVSGLYLALEAIAELTYEDEKFEVDWNQVAKG